MNSGFKENTRFASLIEPNNKKSDIKQEKHIKDKTEHNNKLNSFKNGGQNRQYSAFNKSYKERREEIMERVENEEKKKKEEEDKIKEKEKIIALSLDSFPELAKVNKKAQVEVLDNTTNFLEKLNTNKKVDIQVKDIVEPGWTELTRDRVSNRTIVFSNVKKNEYVKTPQELAYEVLEHLVYLHEKRTNEYIDNWGEDEWDRMFTFPNYDYYYFDKLDEIYEKNNKESDDEYESEEYEEDEY